MSTPVLAAVLASLLTVIASAGVAVPLVTSDGITGPGEVVVGETVRYRAPARAGQAVTWTGPGGELVRDQDLSVRAIVPGPLHIELLVGDDRTTRTGEAVPSPLGPRCERPPPGARGRVDRAAGRHGRRRRVLARSERSPGRGSNPSADAHGARDPVGSFDRARRRRDRAGDPPSDRGGVLTPGGEARPRSGGAARLRAASEAERSAVLDELAPAAAGGDGDAAATLAWAVRHFALAIPAIRQYLLRPTDIDAAEQQTLVAVVYRIGSFRGDSRFTT